MTKLDDNFTVFNLEEGDTVDEVLDALSEQLTEEDDDEEGS